MHNSTISKCITPIGPLLKLEIAQWTCQLANEHVCGGMAHLSWL